jgi:hypothetical protein
MAWSADACFACFALEPWAASIGPVEQIADGITFAPGLPDVARHKSYLSRGCGESKGFLGWFPVAQYVIWHDDEGVEFKGVIIDNMHSYAP